MRSGEQRAAPHLLLGASVPRSGHHLLARLLQRTLGDRLRYCRFYSSEGCCGAVPCRRHDHEILFQKNHDLDLTLPLGLPVTYVVQFRDPVPAALSDRELFASEYGERLAGDPVSLLVWLAHHAIWLVGFLRKWAVTPPAGAMLLPYERLTAAPAASLAALLDRAGIAFAERDLEAAVAEETPRGGWQGERPFEPRSLERSRYLDPQLFALFETLVREQVPELQFRRHLPVPAPTDHAFLRCHAALRAAAAGDLHEAAAGLARLRLELGPHPAVLSELARVAERQGDSERAELLLAAADGGRSDDPALLLRRVTLARQERQFALAETLTRHLIELMPRHQGHRVLLALILTSKGEAEATSQAVDEALASGPVEATHWCSLAYALLQTGAAARALELVERAQQTWPDDPVLRDIGAQARTLLGG